MSWQRCPKCLGTGKDQGAYLTEIINCFICNGFGLINEQTGEPLYKTITNTSAGSIDLNQFTKTPAPRSEESEK